MLAYPLNSIAALLSDLIEVLVIIILIDVVISWARMGGARISSNNPLVRFIDAVVNPLLNPIRRLIPPYKTGNWDLSPIIAVVLLQWIQRILFQYV